MPRLDHAPFAASIAVTTLLAVDYFWIGTLDPRDDEWSIAAHWVGAAGLLAPSARSDSALIDGTTPANPELDLDVAIGAVTIRGGGSLDTNGFEYSVFNSAGLSGDTIIEDPGSTLRIFNDPGNPSNAGTGVIINTGGALLLDTSGLPVNLAARKLDINAGALVEGAGNLTQLGRFGVVSNDGTLRVAGGTLTMQPWDATDIFDWDGTSGAGRIEIENDAALRIQMPVETDFNGDITLADNATLEVQDAWRLDADATITVVFPTSLAPEIVGADLVTIDGTINLSAGSLEFRAPSLFGASSTISLGGDNSIRFYESASILNADAINFGSTSTLLVGANAFVDITEPAGTFDMDGLSGLAKIRVLQSATLSVTVDSIDLPGNQFDGDIELFGALSIDTAADSWTMDGTLDLLGLDPLITGDHINITGLVHAATDATITPPITLGPGSVVDAPNATIDLDSPELTLDGTDVSADLLVISSPTITAANNPSTVQASTIILPSTGLLDISAPLDLSVNFINASLLPATAIDMTTRIDGDGALDIDLQFGGPLSFDGPVTLDGGSPDGAIRGDRVEFNGALTVQQDTVITAPADLKGLVILQGGGLRLFGGTLAAPTRIHPSFTLVDNAAAFFTFEGVTRILSGASFDPDEITAHNAQEGGTLIAEPNTHLGFIFRTRGALRLGLPAEPIGAVNFRRYEQFSTGLLATRLDATGIGSLVGTPTTAPSQAFLAGELHVSLDNAFVPAIGSVYTLLTADTVAGTFDTITGPENMAVIYNADSVQVTFLSPACSPADIDNDGDTDPDDINAFVANFTDAIPGNADVDGDGDEDPDDITAFVNAFIAGC